MADIADGVKTRAQVMAGVVAKAAAKTRVLVQLGFTEDDMRRAVRRATGIEHQPSEEFFAYQCRAAGSTTAKAHFFFGLVMLGQPEKEAERLSGHPSAKFQEVVRAVTGAMDEYVEVLRAAERYPPFQI